MRRGILAATLVALVLSVSASAPSTAATGTGLGWTVREAPFLISFVSGGRVLTSQQATGDPGPGRRMSYGIKDGPYHSLTNVTARRSFGTGTEYEVATTEPGRTALVRVQRAAHGLTVSLTLRPPANVETVFESFAVGAKEHLTGTGGRGDGVDLRGLVLPIKSWAASCRSGMAVPFFSSSSGYGMRFATSAIGRFAFPPATNEPPCNHPVSPCEVRGGAPALQVCFKQASMRYEVYEGSFEQILGTYTARTGRPALPPREQFGLIKWRDQISSGTELLDDVRQLRSRGIPVGWVILDNVWEERCTGSLEFSKSLFADPAATIRGLKREGVRLMLWVSPLFRSWCEPNGYPPGAVLPVGESWRAIDLTNPQARALYEQRLRALFALGVDGVKGDRGDDHDLEQLDLSGGSGVALHNAYPRLFAESVMRALRATPGAVGAGIFRAASTGSQRPVPGVWAGDQTGDWRGLQTAIRHGLTAGMSGFPIWGSDVGGYDSPNLTADVFVRWAQLGAVSPVFEVGGIGPNARPWTMGEQAVTGLRKAAELHYELFPYLYELARTASATGAPVLRPLGYHYPRDDRAWERDLQVLVGRDLLAAPVAHPGTTARVYLPEGAWVDLTSGRTRRGPAALARRTPLDELPLYLRAGSAIPFDLRAQVWRTPWQADDLSRPGRGAWLVAPGGSFTSRSEDYGSLEAARDGSRLVLDLDGARRETQVLVLLRGTPRSVTVDGTPLARSASAAALRGRAQGWLVRPAPFGGVLLKLAPAGGHSSVTLELR